MRIFTLSPYRLRRILKRSLVALCAAGPLLSLAGCANQPPNQNMLSGKRLKVTATFSGFINPSYHYFFLINNVGDRNAHGPVAVFHAPYGNGFATGSGGNADGFTDFVQFDGVQPGNAGYSLYHVIRGSNLSRFSNPVNPINAARPNLSDITGKTLQFEIDLSQLITDANGNPLSTADSATMARSLQYLQVNFIATDRIPIDAATEQNTRVDSLGDTRSGAGRGSFLIVDLTQNTTYDNMRASFDGVQEPSDYDVSGPDVEPSLDLRDWSVQISQQ